MFAVARTAVISARGARAVALRSGGVGAARHYHENIVDHYENPRNVGSLDKKELDVGTGLVGAPACGDVMKLQIRVDENGVITETKFKTFGCGSAIASSSVATEWLKGKTIDESLSIRNTDIAAHLKLPPVKLHCSMLAEDAIKAAVRDYKAKRAAAGGSADEPKAAQASA
ncbi:iron sulfur cluster assembly protein 1, mitochondrial precursor [Tribonema minus]|uniref:Iron-sulfur cluster assembly protein n=1 Tax=Tribonema minus TaxID=303371 RepID=A0A835YL97_9STRA|nr:iron sulfur cluster assembly protein 1, mitochondrial precursor [Tribonema minus]